MSRYESISISPCVAFLLYGIMLIVDTTNPPGSIFSSFFFLNGSENLLWILSFMNETIQAQAFQLEKIDIVTDKTTVYL